MTKYISNFIGIGHHKIPNLSNYKIGVFNSGFGKVLGIITPTGKQYRCAFGIKLQLNKHKIFGVGLGKTGTTTLAACLTTLGFRHRTYSPQLIKAYYKHSYEEIIKAVHLYDSFDDFPWPFLYKTLAEEYPDSKFILTTRKSPEIWYESLKNHFIRAGKPSVEHHPWALTFTLVYKDLDILNSKEELMEIYIEHNQEVKSFFSQDPSRLLELTWENGDSWGKLCDFLDIEKPELELPHANKSPG